MIARTRLVSLFVVVLTGGSIAADELPLPLPTPLPAPAPLRAVPNPASAAGWQPGPVAARTRVYILDGVNPVGLAGVSALGDRLKRSGLPHTEVGSWYSLFFFEHDIRKQYEADPSTRFAIIGYSAGTYAAQVLVSRLLRRGIPVAVLGYVGGDYLRDSAYARMEGVGRVVNVTGDGYLLTGRNWFFNGTNITGAANVRLPGTWHYGLPTHPTTFAALYTALIADDVP